MTDPAAVRLLDELGSLVPDRHPPAAELLQAGKRAKRKKSQRNLAVLAAAALMISGGTATSVLLLRNDSNPSGTGIAARPSTGNPVISMSKPDNSYPAAEVSGLLIKRKGCLLIGNSVAFWPYGTTWDIEEQEVVFTDGLDTTPVMVGSAFEGSGGFYTGDQAAAVIGEPYADAIRDCIARTGAEGAVFAVPNR